MSYNLRNKNVIITGASGGLGKELCRQLIQEYQCRIYGIGRNKEKLEQLKSELGENFSFAIFDAGDREKWCEFKTQLEDEQFSPDILINNAGILPKFTRFGKYSQKEISACMSIDLNSVLYSSEVFLPTMEEKDGTAIVNIASADALCPLAGTSTYSACKSAVKALSEAMREEYRGKVYIPTVCPGFIRTNIMCGQENSDSSLMDKVSMPAEKAARKIIKKLRHGKSRIVIGADAHFMSAAYRIAPVLSQRFFNFVFKATKLSVFSEIYN